ncbi:hemicentin-1 isoform X2 [Camponotus floridanus]|nr:hemicentin-1 isoform X2 [Camponotus floridanus]
MKDHREGWLRAVLLITFLSHQTECAAKNGRAVVEHHPSSYWEQPFSQPYFDNTTKRETTTTVGQSAYLHCRVRNLGDRAVSWIRQRDLHILTVGILTYTNDQRFQSLHSDGSDEWTLKISSPQVRDSGIYECQVSTEPKISQAFNLSVVVSKAKINGNSELYIKSGSDINLTCIVLQTPEPPSFIYWYKGDNVINYSQRGGISVVTEKQTRTSRLLISKALPADSGNYTCAPSTAESASVLVHVLNGGGASGGHATRELQQQRRGHEDTRVTPVAPARWLLREVTGRSRGAAVREYGRYSFTQARLRERLRGWCE